MYMYKYILYINIYHIALHQEAFNGFETTDY